MNEVYNEKTLRVCLVLTVHEGDILRHNPNRFLSQVGFNKVRWVCITNLPLLGTSDLSDLY